MLCSFILVSKSTYRHLSCKMPVEDAQGSSCRLLLFLPLPKETGWPAWQNNCSPSLKALLFNWMDLRKYQGSCAVEQSGKGNEPRTSPASDGPLVKVWDAQGMRGSSFLLKTALKTPPPNLFSTTVRSSRVLLLQAGSKLLPCCCLSQWAKHCGHQGLSKFTHVPANPVTSCHQIWRVQRWTTIVETDTHTCICSSFFDSTE